MKEFKKHLIEVLSTSPLNPMIYLVEYGSMREESDYDLFAVYSQSLTHVDFTIGQLDIFSVGFDQFTNLIQLNDLIVTEPIVTGQLLFGDVDKWETVKQSLIQSRPTLDSIFHLNTRMVQVFNATEAFLERFEANGEQIDAFYFLQNLSFALGYLAFLKEYKKGSYPVTLKEIEIQFPLLKQVNYYKHLCRNGTKAMVIDEMRELLQKAKLELFGKAIKKVAQPTD